MLALEHQYDDGRVGNASGHPSYPTYQLREADLAKDCPQERRWCKVVIFFSEAIESF